MAVNGADVTLNGGKSASSGVLSRANCLLAVIVACDVLGLAALAERDDWSKPLLIAILFVAAALVDRMEVRAPSGLRLDGLLPLAVLTSVLVGAVPGAAVAAIAAFSGRRPLRHAVTETAVYTAVTIPAAATMHFLADDVSAWLVPAVAGAFMVAAGLAFVLVAAFNHLLLGRAFGPQLRDGYLPLLSMHAVQGVLIGAVVLLYERHQAPALVISAVLLAGYLKLQSDLVRARHLEEQATERAERLARTQFGIVRALLDSVEARDRMTARHSAAVARFCRLMAEAVGLSPAEQETVHTAALLHDLGKFTFPDEIFWASHLNEREREIVHGHPAAGADIVRRLDGHEEAAEIVLSHHERWDGGGYPRGLSGTDIPLAARMIAVADTYDVMTSRDSYRPPVSHEQAVDELLRVAGHQLDPELVRVFVEEVLPSGARFEHLEDADFEAELDLDARIRLLVSGPEPR
jgi:putative nucleotidyltransferase with HDIG domain